MAYMEQTQYPAHYGAMADRSAPVFGTETHEPRAPRPFDAHPTADPYGAPAGVPTHPQSGTMDEPHSPLSSYRGSFSHPSSMGLPHHRQDSISSISSPHDVTGGSWAPSSPGLAASRHASIYSLNGQFDSVGLGGSSIDSGSTGGHFYDQSPPLPAQLRYAQNQAADARRFSLDERAIRTQPQLAKPGMVSADYQAPNTGRHWPWGASSSAGIHGRHASVSAAPPQSYDHTRMTYGAPSGMQPAYGYDANAMMSPTRYRSMSSSAASGRSYGNPYGPPGSAAHAAAAMGYGMAPHLGPGMMLEGDIPGGPGPARRAKFKRSRTGCLVCRKRKVKCSQDGTPCKQCRIGKRDCHYDENPQKKKTGKKEKTGSSIDGGSSDKGTNPIHSIASINGDSQGHAAGASGMGHADPYYATNSAVDQRSDSTGGVTFSMPFSQAPAPVSTHATNADANWTNPSPFGTGPHGETHSVSQPDGYGWPSKQAPEPTQPAAYGDHAADRHAAYWSQHPTSYAPRTAELEATETH
ncbi:hypothetical protein BCV70DRAFT_79114 [Testicularia cyperi]|uniref:Zn(2)-C6 fungal-type domain-containing protein n=1 Tax=Testicularia cyperi TaxID=1882483 RepID=A0A317XUJ7_9BASI|nr:hypothetical protein BCV70DRAFT_79114 [Testicularia cyperi]